MWIPKVWLRSKLDSKFKIYLGRSFTTCRLHYFPNLQLGNIMVTSSGIENHKKSVVCRLQDQEMSHPMIAQLSF